MPHKYHANGHSQMVTGSGADAQETVGFSSICDVKMVAFGMILQDGAKIGNCFVKLLNRAGNPLFTVFRAFSNLSSRHLSDINEV